MQSRDDRQEVTGITVNEFTNLNRKYIRKIRAMLHAWEKFGLESAEKEHQAKYYSKQKSEYKTIPSFKQVLRGKIEYIRMVKGTEDPIYHKFLKNYLKLSNSIKD